MARPVRKSRVKKVSLSEVKDDLSRYLREAEDREVVITRHGKPAGYSSGSRRRTIGSTTGFRTTHVFWRTSRKLGRTCAPGEAFAWRMRSEGGA